MIALRTNEIVAGRIGRQAKQLRQHVGEGAVRKLVVFRDELGAEQPGIRSYTAMLHRQIDQVRHKAGSELSKEVPTSRLLEVHTALPADLIHMVKDANADPSVSQILVMSPTDSEAKVTYQDIMAEVGPEKDVDGMNSDLIPCTPLAVKGLLDDNGLWMPDLDFTLVGRGVTVGAPLYEEFKYLMGEEGREQRVHVITRSNQTDLRDVLSISNVAIVAAGVRHQIQADMIPPKMRAVVGVCMYDIHPYVYDIPRQDLLVTPVHLDLGNLGVGANTSSIAIQRTFDSPAPPIS